MHFLKTKQFEGGSFAMKKHCSTRDAASRKKLGSTDLVTKFWIGQNTLDKLRRVQI